MSKQNKTVRAVGLALVLAIGFALIYAVAVAWGWSSLESFADREDSIDESLGVSRDGTPVITRKTYNEHYEHEKTEYRSLVDGKEVASPGPTGGWLQAASLPIPRIGKGMFPIAGRQRIDRFADGQGAFWYFIDDGARDGRGYFVGYDAQSNRRVGFIGRSGFHPDQPPVEDWFPMDGVKLLGNVAFPRGNATRDFYRYAYDNSGSMEGFPGFTNWTIEMISGTEVLQIDFLDKSVRTFMESPEMISAGVLIALVPDKSSKNLAKGSPPTDHLSESFDLQDFLAVRTPDRVVLLDAAAKQHSAYVIPEELRDRDFRIYEIGKDAVLLTYYAGLGKEPKANLAVHSYHGSNVTNRASPNKGSDTKVEKLVWIDTAGKVTRRAEAELYGGHRRDEHQEAWGISAALPSPLALAFYAAVIEPFDDMDNGKPQGYFTLAGHHLAVFALPMVPVSLLAAALALFCWRRNRRFFQPASMVWLVFVFLTGLPGLVGYLFHRRWSVLEACPSCRQIVPRDRNACAACAAEFPPPPLKGIEVFA